MGCGGSKEDVATGNTTANGAGRGGKLFRRKSTVSANHRSSHASPPSSSDDTSVVVKDVFKEPSAGEPKADVEVASAEKPVAVVVEEKKEEVVVKKDVADDVDATAAATVTEATVVMEQQPKEEEELPKSTMADEAVPVVTEEAKVDEAVLQEETSPAPTNEDGKSVGQSTTESMKAKPVDEHEAEEAAAVSESSSSEKSANEQTATAAAAQSVSPSN